MDLDEVKRPEVDPAAAPIVIVGLTKSFGGVLAVHDLSFTVQPGRVSGFLGPNGAGKTTTLRMLVGLVARPRAGPRSGGMAYADLPHPQRKVGCALEASFHPGRTGRNHLPVLAPRREPTTPGWTSCWSSSG